jgi:signal recognition particle subunit SRP54
VTGKPIKLIGTGEKMDALDDFHPQRIANRILGMGDIVALVEKAAETIDAEKAMRIADKMRKGKFDLQDMADQLAQVETMGGLGGIMGLLPGMGKIKEQMAAAKIDNNMIKRQRAIILSMTAAERRNPDILKASRKKRIAAGSGTKVEEVNRLLKQHRTTADMMKAMGGAKRGPMAQMAQAFGLGGGMPQPSPEEIAELQKKFGGGAGMGAGIPPTPPPGAFASKPTLPGLPGLGSGKPGGLPGLPGLPSLGGLPSLNPFGKKK